MVQQEDTDRCELIGRGRAHVKALKYAKYNEFTNIIILEDDYVFSMDFKNMQTKIREFLHDYEK